MSRRAPRARRAPVTRAAVAASVMCVACVAAATTAPTLGAQSRPATADGRPSVGAPHDQPDDGRWHRARCLLGVGYHLPTRLTVSAAFGVRRMGERRTTCAFVAPQVGLGGAAIAPGIATTIGRYGGGVGVSGAIVRTFANPAAAAPRRTYAGVRAHLWPVLGLHAAVGWFRAVGDVASLDDRERSFVAWSVGFGF